MAKLVKILGVPKLKVAVQQHKKELAFKTSRALRIVGLFLQRHSQLLVPIDTGALRNSAFTRHEGTGFDTAVRVGYTVEYGVYVHENLMAHHPIGQAKFLEQPLNQRRNEMRALFKKEVGRGGTAISFGGVNG